MKPPPERVYIFRTSQVRGRVGQGDPGPVVSPCVRPSVCGAAPLGGLRNRKWTYVSRGNGDFGTISEVVFQELELIPSNFQIVPSVAKVFNTR